MRNYIYQILLGCILTSFAIPQALAEAPAETLTEQKLQTEKLSNVVRLLTEDFGTTFTIVGGIEDMEIVYSPEEESLESSLKIISSNNELRHWKNNKIDYMISDMDYYLCHMVPCGCGVTKIFRPDHISAEELSDLIEPYLIPDTGYVIFDVESNKVIVEDRLHVIEEIIPLIRIWDKPRPLL